MSPRPSPSRPGPSDTRRVRLLVASLAANLVLLAVLVRPAKPDGPAASNPETSADLGAPTAQSSPAFRRRPSAKPGSDRTPWSFLESTNLAEYAANLRRAGCPEETVCDILRPAVGRTFRAQIEQAERAGDFWAVGGHRRELNRAAVSTRAALQEEQDRLLASFPCAARESRDWLDGIIVDVVAGFVAPAIRDEIRALVAEVGGRVSWWRERTGGILLPEDLEAIRRERDGFEARLAGMLTQSQLDEWGLRMFWIKNFVFGTSRAIEELGLSATEFREFCRILSLTETERVGPLAELEGMLEERNQPASEADTAAALRKLLGNIRYETYVRHSDSVFQGAQQLATEFRQPSALAEQVAGLMSEWRAEIPALHSQWTTDRESTRAALLERREDYRRRLEQVLAAVPADRRRAEVEKWTDEVLREKWNKP